MKNIFEFCANFMYFATGNENNVGLKVGNRQNQHHLGGTL